MENCDTYVECAQTGQAGTSKCFINIIDCTELVVPFFGDNEGLELISRHIVVNILGSFTHFSFISFCT